MRRTFFLIICLFVYFFGYSQYIPTNGVFKTIADLQSQKGTPWVLATLLGRDSLNDRQGGTFYWNDTATITGDNDNVISVTGVSTGRWIRRENKRIYYFRSINALSTGSTKLFTTAPASFGRFLVQSVNVITKSISGTLVVTPSINIGYTATSYNDIASTIPLANLTINTNQLFSLVSNYTTVPSSTGVYCNVVTAGTGLTTMTFDIYIEGIYEK